MTVEGAVTANQDLSFDDMLRALKSLRADSLDEALTVLEQRGVRVPKTLVDAIRFYRFEGTGEELYEFLQAMRDVFEPVWRSRRFLPPFSVEFEDVSSRMQELFISMLKEAGVRNPGDYIYLSESYYTPVLVLFIPISKHEVHMVALTVRRRRWYIPPSKAQENLNQLVRQVQGAKGRAGEHKKRVANETFVLIGRYTRGVKGAFKRKGYSRSKRAALVFDDRKRGWFILLLRFLRNLFSKRLNRQEESLGDKRPFGDVAERMRVLRSYLSVLDRILALNRAAE